MKEKITVLILLLVASQSLSQPVKNRFVHFTEQEGLPSNVINTIIQDSLGYIWIGTANGISKYNGYEFDNFTVAPSDTNFLQLPLTTSLYEDSKGIIWIGSVDGLTRYDRNKKTFKLFSLSPFSQKHERTLMISGMAETSNGNILLTVTDFYYFTIKNGLFLLDKKTNQINEVSVSNEDSTDFLLDIKAIGNDKFLVAGAKGVAEYSLTKNQINWFKIKENTPVISILKGYNNELWLGTFREGLIRYNMQDSTYNTFHAFNNLLDNGRPLAILKVIYDLQKNLYLASNKSLIHFDVQTEEISISEINPQNPSSLHSSNLNGVLLDNSGSVWIASNEAGVSKYDIVKNNFRSYTAKADDENSISPGWVGNIFESKENELWLSSTREKIVKFNLKNETFKEAKLPQNFEVFDIIKTSGGKTILTGGGAVYSLDPVQWKFTTLDLPINLTNNVVFCGFEVSNNSLWFGTADGLYIYDKLSGVTTKIEFKNLGLGDAGTNQVNLITKDKNGNIWIGTPNGLIMYDISSRVFSRIGYSKEPSKSFKSQDINSLYVDNNNNIWIGTWLGGLNKYDQKNGSIESFTQKEGLPSHSVQGILGDEENGFLWLSTFDGISRFDIEKKTFSNFRIDDGIHSNLFADGSALKTSNGLLVFGGSNGITVINPKDIQNNLVPPKITITDLKIFNESIIPGNNSVLSEPIYKTKKLTLNYDENDIELNYFAAHFVNPQKNQFAYKLENYEEDWRYVGNQRSAIYPNLPPGNYTFHLKASNNNKIWNEKGISIDIVIKNPWWRTFWAYGSYLFILFGFLYGVRKVELKRQKKNAELKESQLRAEAAELQARAIQAENDRKSKELDEARKLQLSMLPKELPKLPNLDIAVYMKTATEVGGDYYDFNISLDGTLTVVLGDATGHGMKAGTMVTTTKSLFNVLAPNPDIKNTFHEMTRCLKGMHLEKLAMCLTMLKITKNKLRMSAAGMPPVLLYRSEKGSVEEHVFKGMPLGTMTNFPYTIEETLLGKGDTILLLSDGFPELQNKEKEMIGYQKTRILFENNAKKSPEEIIEEFKKFQINWTNGHEPDDDLTFVVIKVK